MIEEVRAFEGGHCRQLLAMVDRHSWRIVRFSAVFLALRHRKEGWVLIDTGYGTRFKEATARIPFCFYRWATPATPAGSTTDLLGHAGIQAANIRHVIVTHFHADHVGGLAEFPHATVHFHREALETLQRLPAWRQVRAAFLPLLIPSWLPNQAKPLAPDAFSTTAELPLGSHDLFDDESVRLVHLPGHAPGQVGVIFNRQNGREFYAADAFWRRCQIVDSVDPLGIAMALQWNANTYRHTIRLLRQVHQQGGYRITACHDEGTCSQLNKPAPIP
jgi:glyoxylase-like metal-dependent hydrolase (beta-lactamase superfamily II)